MKAISLVRSAGATCLLLSGIAMAFPAPASAQITNTVYVVNSGDGTVAADSVTAIDTQTNLVSGTITVGNDPGGIAITPDGTEALVTNTSDDNVTPIDTATNTPGTVIPAGDGPSGIAITPNGMTAYVADFNGKTVTPIDIPTGTPGSPITVGNGPSGIAITPDGKTVYVANQTDGSVTPIATATNTAGTTISVGTDPQAIAITPDGKTAYVVNNGSSNVTPIHTATNVAGTPITVGSEPADIAISADGVAAYVTLFGGSVVTIPTWSNVAFSPATVGTVSIGVAVHGSIAYVGTSGNAVKSMQIDSTTGAIVGPSAPIPVGTNPVAIAATPVPTTLSISAPKAVKTGARVSITGVLTSDDPACARFKPVLLKKGSGTIASAVTRVDGSYTLKTRITRKMRLRVAFAGTLSCGPSLSARKTISVT
jgi:YVTN family beta-propeller protein